MDKYAMFTIFVSLFSCAHATVKIIDLNVHDSIQYGTTDEIVLDCNFEASSNESAVMKWFYNGDVDQIYQWILEMNGPGYPMGRLKNRLDLEHTVSNGTHTMYKAALKIRNVTYDLTGNYTCKVSGDYSEDSKTKQLVIYSPAKSDLEIILFKMESFVICTVNGIYPMPEIDFYILDGNTTKDISEDINADVDDDGYFNVTARHHFENSTLFSSTIFVCNLTIPGTDYTLSKTLEYQIDYDSVIEYEEDFNLLLNSSNYTTEGYYNITEDSSGIVQRPASYLATLLLIVFFFLSK